MWSIREINIATQNCQWIQSSLFLDSRTFDLFGFRSETSDSLASSPDFLSADLIKFLLECLSVILSATEFQGSLGFSAILDRVVEIIENGLLLTSRKRVYTLSASLNRGAQSSAPRRAVVEQASYIQSIPFAPMRGYKL